MTWIGWIIENACIDTERCQGDKESAETRAGRRVKERKKFRRKVACIANERHEGLNAWFLSMLPLLRQLDVAVAIAVSRSGWWKIPLTVHLRAHNAQDNDGDDDDDEQNGAIWPNGRWAKRQQQQQQWIETKNRIFWFLLPIIAFIRIFDNARKTALTIPKAGYRKQMRAAPRETECVVALRLWLISCGIN